MLLNEETTWTASIVSVDDDLLSIKLIDSAGNDPVEQIGFETAQVNFNQLVIPRNSKALCFGTCIFVFDVLFFTIS